jgi:NAD(P)H-dependent flavin oxidoreductase YrpB (nitropropane dioxygenase family)
MRVNITTVPIVQGGMQWVGYAELASAVSNAGGLGIVRHPIPTSNKSMGDGWSRKMNTNTIASSF